MRRADEAPYFLRGGGESGELIRSIDWLRTPVGDPATWPAALRTTVATILNSRHPMFLWWGPELIQFYNDAYLPSFGVGKHPAAMGQPGRECWREIWPIIGPQIADVVERGEASWHEDHHVPIARNGGIEEVYWTYGYSPVFDDAGHIGGTLVVCTETTGRVLAERRLTFLRSLAISLLEAREPVDAPTRVAAVLPQDVHDIPFAILYVRGELRSFVGVDAERVAAIDAELRGAFGTVGTVALREPVVAGPWPEPVRQVRVIPLDREGRDVAVFGLSSRLPFDATYRSFLEQIVEQSMTARARIRVESERRHLLEQAPVPAALMVGPNHVFEIANPHYRAMVGRDVVGKTYLEAFPELRDTALPATLDRVYQLGQPFVTSETSVRLDRHGDGRLEDCFFKFNLEPIRDSEGRVFGMMAIASDITEQVKARRALEAIGRAKDEFLATMSHELRTPLNAILGWANILKADHSDPAKLAKGLTVIERNTRTEVRLVNDLLDVSRIITGKLRLALSTIDVASVIQAAVEVVRPAADAKGVELDVRVAPDIGTSVADPDRVQQIVWNLVSNAVRFTPARGVVRIDAIDDNGALRIDVKDTGAGIPPAYLPFIFDRFTQLNSSTTRAQGGLGLGLAIVRYLAEAHGGAVTASSEGVGLGATFTVFLPRRTTQPDDVRAPAAETPAPLSARVDEEPLRAIRVLAVDDDRDSLDVLRVVLEGAGAKVTTASSARDALSVGDAFDVVISDIGMPGLDGYDFIRRLRARDEAAAIPALALTAFARAEDARRAHEAGYEEHLAKPFDPARLIETVRVAVARTRRPL